MRRAGGDVVPDAGVGQPGLFFGAREVLVTVRASECWGRRRIRRKAGLRRGEGMNDGLGGEGVQREGGRGCIRTRPTFWDMLAVLRGVASPHPHTGGKVVSIDGRLFSCSGGPIGYALSRCVVEVVAGRWGVAVTQHTSSNYSGGRRKARGEVSKNPKKHAGLGNPPDPLVCRDALQGIKRAE